MSDTKQVNNQPSTYQELNDFELEIVCGGTPEQCQMGNLNGDDFVPDTVSHTKSEAT